MSLGQPATLAARARRLAGLLLTATFAWVAHAQSATPPAASAASCPPALQPPSPEQIAQAQRQARDRGFLWRIRKDGRDSYLFGTVHVGRLAWAMPGPKLAEAVRTTDTLALELDLADPQLQAQLGAPGAMGTPTPLPPALETRLARLREAACLPAELASRMHPLMLAMTVLVTEARREGLHGEFAQELVLSGMARALKRPVVSLESLERQMRAMIPADPTRAETLLDGTLAQLERPDARRVLRRLAEVWDQGRLAELEDYASWCECVHSDAEREQMLALIEARNPALADAIDALHRAGKRTLAAVGALHMVGPQGLPQLLAQRGYTVERVAYAPM